MLDEINVMLVKEETEYGTDPTPTPAANALQVWGVKFKEVADPAERQGQSSSLSPLAAKLGAVYATITFNAELKGSGTAGVASRIGDLLEACGRNEGAVVGSSVSYLPKSTSVKSVTMYLYKDARKHVISGAKGNAKIITPAGKQAYVEFTMTGLFAAPTDATTPTDCVYEDTVAPVCKGGTVSLNSVTTLAIEQSELDFGNEVVVRKSKTAATGVAGVEITRRKPMLSINPEAVAISTLDIRALMLTTPVAYSEVIGATGGNIITISVPKFNMEAPEYGEREGIVTEALKGACTKNSDAGNDEQSIIFT